jgi:hypothetical protein
MKKILQFNLSLAFLMLFLFGMPLHVSAQSPGSLGSGAVGGAAGGSILGAGGGSVGSASTCTQGSFCPLAPIPGLDQGIQPTSSSIAQFLNNLYQFLIGIAAAIAVIEIVWGGLEISTKDSVSKNSDGKERITQAILGLILVLSPVLVFKIINPSILNFSATFSPVNIPSGAAQQTSTPTPSTTSSPVSCSQCASYNGSQYSQCESTCTGGAVMGH